MQPWFLRELTDYAINSYAMANAGEMVKAESTCSSQPVIIK
jgi:hypothetical protein